MKHSCRSVRRPYRDVGGDSEALRRPVEASTLPVSDKPVTLNFNKVPGNASKPHTTVAGLSSLLEQFYRRLDKLSFIGSLPATSLKAVSLGFSFGDDPSGAGEGEEQSPNANESKSEASGERSLGNMLMSNSVQSQPPRKLPL